MTESAIIFEGVSKSFGDSSPGHTSALAPKKSNEDKIVVLQDVSFSIAAGETIGLIGRNGSGKSTLLRLASRILWPDAGTVTTHGRVAPVLELGAGLHPELSGVENLALCGMLLGMSRKETREKKDLVIEMSGLGPAIDRRVKHYSSGMIARLSLAIAMVSEPTILLLDEILAVGDITYQRSFLKRLDKLRKNGVTMILSGHELHSFSSLCDRVLLLSGGRVQLLNPARAIEAYLSDIAQEGACSVDKHESQGITVEVTSGRDKTLPYQSTFHIDLSISSSGGFRNANLAIVFKDELDRRVFDINSLEHNVLVSITDEALPISVRIRVPTLPLRPGSYYCDVWLVQEPLGVLYYQPRICKVFVSLQGTVRTASPWLAPVEASSDTTFTITDSSKRPSSGNA